MQQPILPAANPRRYILYARKSSKEKTRQAQSIEDQIGALLPLAQREGLTVVATLTESRSAKGPGRPVFSRMLEMLQKGQADAILTWHLNRLTRNEIDSGTLRWLLRQGVIQEIVTPQRTYRPGDNALITAVESAMGEQFIVELTANSRRGMLSKVEKGWFPGFVPQGYKNDLATRTIVRDPQRWDLIRWAWDEMLTGTMTVPKIAQQMSKEWGYRTPLAGRGMAPSTLYAIFSNVFYTGAFLFEGKLYPGRHEPMVTLQEFEAVQRLLGRKGSKRNRKHEFAYSGLIRCGVCGRAVCADRKKKAIKDTGEERFHTYYACTRGGRCSGRVKEADIEAMIGAHLESVSMPAEYLDYASDVAERFRQEERRAEEAVRASQTKALSDTERQMDELLSLRLRGLIDDDEYAARKARLAEERSSVLMNARNVAEAAECSWEALENVADFCANAGRVFTEGGLREKANIARQLGASYVLSHGRVEVEMDGLLGLVREHKKKAALTAATLEPAGTDSVKVKSGSLDPVRLGWRASLDAIRTKAMQDHLCLTGLR